MTLEEAYEAGREQRRQSEEYTNPLPRGSVEQRAFYDGWCWENFVRWRTRTRSLEWHC